MENIPYWKKSILVLPFHFLTGKYHQIRVVIRNHSPKPKIELRVVGVNIPFYNTGFVPFKGHRMLLTTVLFISKEYSIEDIEIAQGQRHNGNFISLDRDDFDELMRLPIHNCAG